MLVSTRDRFKLSDKSLDYSPALDGLRAMAALMIVLYHARMPGLSGGFLAVDVFFVLSGYLITCVLMKGYRVSRKLDYCNFLARRVRRLLPALWLFLSVYIIVSLFLFTDQEVTKHIKDAIFSAFYVINYTSAYWEPVAILGHMWTLSVEMQFYLVWPLLIFLLVRVNMKLALLILVLLYLTATAGRWWAGDVFPNVWDVYVRTHTHCSGLILGGVLAVWNRRIHSSWGWLGLLLIVFSVTFFSAYWAGTVRYGFTVAEIGAALIILSQPAWLGNRSFAWLGVMSYGVYLWHYLFIKIVGEYDLAWEVTAVIAGGMGLLCAIISYYCLEIRFHRRNVSARTEKSE